MRPTSIRPGIGPGGAPLPALSMPLQWRRKLADHRHDTEG